MPTAAVTGWDDSGADPIVSTADMKIHLNFPAASSTNDDEIDSITAEATDILANKLGRTLYPTTVTEVHDPENNGIRLQLLHVPCACVSCLDYRQFAITSVTIDGTALDSSAYHLEPRFGTVTRDPLTTWTATDQQGISIVYTTGYATYPKWLTLGLKRFVSHLWQQSQRPRGRPVASSEANPIPGAAFLLPYAIESIIQQHGQGVLIA